MNSADEFELRLSDVVTAIGRHRTSVAVLTCLGIVAMTALAFVLPKIYRVESVLITVAGQQSSVADSLLGQLGGLGGIAGSFIGGGTVEEEAIAFLQSRTLARDFILQGNLLSELFPESKEESGDESTVWDGVRKFEQDIRRVERDRVSGLIRFAVEWTDANTAMEWNLGLVREANSRLRERAIEEAQTNLKFLEKELQKTSVVELRNSIYDLMESQISAIMLAEARPDYAFRIVDLPMIPDPDEFVRPRRVLYTLLGALLGIFAGTCLAVYLERDLFTARARL